MKTKRLRLLARWGIAAAFFGSLHLAGAATVLTNAADWAFAAFLGQPNSTSRAWTFGNTAANAPTVTLNGVTVTGNLGLDDPGTSLDFTSDPLTYGISGYSWNGSDQKAARDAISRGGLHGGTGSFAMNLGGVEGRTYLIEIVSLQNSGTRSMDVSVDGLLTQDEWQVPGADPYNRVLKIETVCDADGVDLLFGRGTTGTDQNPAIVALAITQTDPPVAPTIGIPPQGFQRYVGEYGPSNLTVVALGSPSLSYRWQKNGVDIGGADSAVLPLNAGPLNANDSANYLVIVSNPLGSATSAVASVAVLIVPGIPTSLSAYWNFDETNGLTATDSTANANHGSLVNFPGDDSQWASGRIGGALRFRGPGVGLNDYVDVPNYPKPSSTLTLSAWVWADSRPTWASIIKNWPSSQQQFHFGLQAGDGDLSNYLIQQGGAQLGPVREGAGTPLPTASWQHVALVCDGRNMRLYRNGVSVGEPLAYDGTIQTNPVNSYLSIGAKRNDTVVDSFWHGLIDDLGLWTRGLTADEIYAIYVAGQNGQPLTSAEVGDPPSIASPPRSLTRYAGEAATFTVSAGGTSPLSYHWRKDDLDLAGANAATLLLPGVTTADAGQYVVVVNNAFGSITSAPAALVVQEVPGLSTALGGYWDFDDGSGSTLTDLSPYANHGLLRNGPTWTAGRFGGALEFSGSAQDVFVPDYPKSSSTLTLAAWVWADSRPTWASIAKNWPNGGQFHLGLDSNNGQLSCYLRQANNAQLGPARDSTVFATNSWQHVAVVYDGAKMRVYRNGAEVASLNYNGTLLNPPPGAYFTIASKATSATAADSFWDGKIDDLGYWTRGLTPAEIQAIHQEGLANHSLAEVLGPRPPGIGRQPTGLDRYVGERGALSVSAGGDRPLTFQWYKDGVLISDTASGIFPLTNIASGDAGDYEVVISNPSGSITSAPAALIVREVTEIMTGLTGYWNFDEGFGDLLIDYSGNGNDGTLMNFPTDDSQWTAGQVEGALNFAGPVGSNYVVVPNYPKPDDTMTVSAWVWADERPTWATIVKNWPYGVNTEFHFGLRANNGNLNNYLNQADGTQVFVDDPDLFPLGAWQHVAFVCDGAQMRLYRNATLVGAVPYNGTIMTSNIMSAMGIGAKLATNGLPTDDPSYWQGKMDDLGLWSRGLTDDEILAIFVAGQNGRPLSEAVPGAVAPTLTQLPQSQAKQESDRALLVATAVGTPPLRFQWFKDGGALSDETNATYAIPYVRPADAGEYVVVACNVAGCTTSSPPALLTVIPAQPIVTGLVGYWPFDESSGLIAVDSSNYGNDGELRNFPTDDSQWVAGQVGGALNFRGPATGDYVLVPDYPKPTSTLTISAWAWADARPTWASIAKNWPENRGQFHLGLNSSDGRLSCYVAQASDTQVGPAIDTDMFPIGSWQHVATVFDGSRMIVYRNGVEVGAIPYDGTIKTNLLTPTLAIGAKVLSTGLPPAGADSGFWQGRIDDLGLWTAALTPGQILAVYHAGAGGFPLTQATLEAEPPVITAQPQDLMRFPGETAAFNVVATVDGPIHYQWFFRDNPLPGEQGATLTIANVQAEDAGAYAVVVYGLGGSATSQPVILTVAGLSTMLPLLPTASGWLIQLNGTPSFSYDLERTSDFTGAWDSLGTLTVSPNGLGQLEDTNPPPSRAFYRARFQQP